MISVFAPNTVSAPKLIAHRGYAVSLPQNSICSFKEAARRKYWAIETDIRKTKDGVLVCSHDDTLLKHFGVDDVISNCDFAYLRTLRRIDGAGCPQDELVLPTFEEYLNICKEADCLPFIETKTPDVPEVLETAFRFFGEDEIVLSSCSFDHVLTAREVSKNVFIHHIFSDTDKCRILSEKGNAGLSYNYPNLDDVPDGLIDFTHSLGVRLCLRAGDTREKAVRMLEMGLDYIPTNCIDKLED